MTIRDEEDLVRKCTYMAYWKVTTLFSWWLPDSLKSILWAPKRKSLTLQSHWSLGVATHHARGRQGNYPREPWCELRRNWEDPPRTFPGLMWGRESEVQRAFLQRTESPLRYSAVWTMSHSGLRVEPGPSTQKRQGLDNEGRTYQSHLRDPLVCFLLPNYFLQEKAAFR